MTRWRDWLLAISVIGLIVILSSVAKAIVILSSASQFTAEVSDNKVSGVLGVLPPALSAAAALMYALTRIRNAPEPSADDGDRAGTNR